MIQVDPHNSSTKVLSHYAVSRVAHIEVIRDGFYFTLSML